MRLAAESKSSKCDPQRGVFIKLGGLGGGGGGGGRYFG